MEQAVLDFLTRLEEAEDDGFKDLRNMLSTLPKPATNHFHDMYINGKDNAKLTGDRMKMLMLTLPFMVRDLITPEVSWVIQGYPMSCNVVLCKPMICCVIPS